jgi:hypothetical protein
MLTPVDFWVIVAKIGRRVYGHGWPLAGVGQFCLSPVMQRVGCDVMHIQRESIHKAMPLTRPSIRGSAVRPS